MHNIVKWKIQGFYGFYYRADKYLLETTGTNEHYKLMLLDKLEGVLLLYGLVISLPDMSDSRHKEINFLYSHMFIQ